MVKDVGNKEIIMADLISKTGERIIPKNFESKEEYLIYLRHLFTYEFCKKNIAHKNLVLDLGCGEGYGTNLLSKQVRQIIGLDVDEETINHATSQYGSSNCIFKRYNGIKIPFKDESFDAIVSFQVIEHIEDDLNYLSEAHRVLKDNGIFILATPNRTYRLKSNQKPWNRFHVREYDEDQLESILSSKFSEVKIWGIRGTEEVQKIETKRVEKILKAVSLDPLNLRNLMPERLKLILIKLLKDNLLKNKKIDSKLLDKYNLKDFNIIKNNLADSLDLLAICRKS